MRKEDLMKMEGMTEALAEAIVKAHKEELNGFVPKSRLDEATEAKKNAEALLKERDKQLEDLKKSAGSSEELKKQIAELQETNKNTVADYEAKIKQMQIDNAVSAALTSAGAKNTAAVKALLKDLDKAELDEDGSVKGLADQIKSLQKAEDSSFLFVSTKPESPKASGATPAGSKGMEGNLTITKEQFNKMGYQERVDLYNTNKDLYDSLKSN